MICKCAARCVASCLCYGGPVLPARCRRERKGRPPMRAALRSSGSWFRHSPRGELNLTQLHPGVHFTHCLLTEGHRKSFFFSRARARARARAHLIPLSTLDDVIHSGNTQQRDGIELRKHSTTQKHGFLRSLGKISYTRRRSGPALSRLQIGHPTHPAHTHHRGQPLCRRDLAWANFASGSIPPGGYAPQHRGPRSNYS